MLRDVLTVVPQFGRVACLLIAGALSCGGAAAQDAPSLSVAAQQHLLIDTARVSSGSSTPSVIAIEFFDYNCPYCKKLAPALKSFLQADQQAAVVYKDWPIFGGVSVYAARCALAAQYQGGYIRAHDALFEAPRLAQESQVDATLLKAGLDLTRLKRDLADHGPQIDATLARIDAEARGLGIHGTPGLLMGRQRVSGVATVDELQSAAAIARRAH